MLKFYEILLFEFLRKLFIELSCMRKFVTAVVKESKLNIYEILFEEIVEFEVLRILVNFEVLRILFNELSCLRKKLIENLREILFENFEAGSKMNFYRLYIYMLTSLHASICLDQSLHYFSETGHF